MAIPAVEESTSPNPEVAAKPKKGTTLLSFVGIAILLGVGIGAIGLASTFIENWAAQYETAPQTEPQSQPVRQQPATVPTEGETTKAVVEETETAPELKE